jgi:hypothetical protein
MTRVMPTESKSSAPAASTTPRMFCKKCGYVLVGLESRVCPECGRTFDPANRRTFAARPPRRWAWRWGKRLAALVLLVMLTAGATLGWLWWGWHAEQPTIARLGAFGQRVTVAHIGPPRLRWVLGKRWGYLIERVNWAEVTRLEAAKTEQLDFRSLTQIEQLTLWECESSSHDLSNLAGLVKLRELGLYGLRVEKPDLAFLEKLPALSKLYLSGKWVSSAGFEQIGRLGHLKELSLFETGTTDGDLQRLRGLSSLERLNLERNPISDAGLVNLQGLKSLKLLWVDLRLVDSPGMAKLKQAIPGLQVSGR